MRKDEIVGIVADIISDKLGNYSTVTEETNIFNDLGFDSLDTVHFIMECEKSFNIGIDETTDPEVQNIETISQIVDYIETKLN